LLIFARRRFAAPAAVAALAASAAPGFARPRDDRIRRAPISPNSHG